MRGMRILSPVNSSEEVIKLIRAGADELYCGVVEPSWTEEYLEMIFLNKRPHETCNFQSFDELKKAIDVAHSYNVKMFLTLNSLYYIERQYPLIMKIVNRTLDMGIDGFILSDVGLLLKLHELKIATDLVVSTCGSVYNSEAIKFFQNLGASRITLPRHLTIREIRELSLNTQDIELEVIILNSKCLNDEGFCGFSHGLHNFAGKGFEGGGCTLNYDIYVSSNNKNCGLEKHKVQAMQQRFSIKNSVPRPACGACALYDFNKIGISSVKIVGREFTTPKKIRDVNFVRQTIELLKNKDISRNLFESEVRKLYFRSYNAECIPIKCYYFNEVWG